MAVSNRNSPGDRSQGRSQERSPIFRGSPQMRAYGAVHSFPREVGAGKPADQETPVKDASTSAESGGHRGVSVGVEEGEEGLAKRGGKNGGVRGRIDGGDEVGHSASSSADGSDGAMSVDEGSMPRFILLDCSKVTNVRQVMFSVLRFSLLSFEYVCMSALNQIFYRGDT